MRGVSISRQYAAHDLGKMSSIVAIDVGMPIDRSCLSNRRVEISL